MDFYFSWVSFFSHSLKNLSGLLKYSNSKWCHWTSKELHFPGVFPPNECAAVQMLCSQTGFTGALLAAQQLAGFLSSEGEFGSWMSHSQCRCAQQLIFTLLSTPGMVCSHHTCSACSAELCLCGNPCHKNPTLLSCGIFSSEMEENQFAFRIRLMKKTKKQLNFSPRPVHVFKLNMSCDTPEYKNKIFVWVHWYLCSTNQFQS